jgi:peptidoglycan/xylan/chitin deacetylase (PgdA/CDA1 family)
MTARRYVRQGIKSAARVLLKLFSPGHSRLIRVLTYHSVDDSGSLISVTRDELREQLALLRGMHIRGLTAAEFIEQKRNPANFAKERAVLLTFDDGYENFLREAMPLLKEFEYPATVFVVPRLMGQVAQWYERDALSISKLVSQLTQSATEAERYFDQMRPLAAEKLMSWEQAAEIVAAGFDVSSHSNDHHFLTSLSDEKLEADLAMSRQTIRDRLQVPADVICYPYGDCDDRVARIARQVGYRFGFRVDPSNDTDDLQLGRWSIAPGLRSRGFQYLFSRAADVEVRLRSRG